MKTAILIDGAFYLRQAKKIWKNQTPEEVAATLATYCRAHIARAKIDNRNCDLYRVFYYDCPPAHLQTQNPVNGEHILYWKTPEAAWRLSFFDELKKKRKTALRLGEMDSKNPVWLLRGRRLKQLLAGSITVDDLEPDDVELETRQKGVDMRIGMDIASLAYKKQVEQIILIAGDSDFVPAAKLARREGIDFILDPMWVNIKDDLFEHIDGKRSMIKKPDSNGKFDGHIIFPRLTSARTENLSHEKT